MKYVPKLPSVNVSNYVMPQVEDTLSRDEDARRERAEILERQSKNTFFFTIKQALLAIAGPLTAAGLSLAVSGVLQESEEVVDAVKDAASDNAEQVNSHLAAGLAMMGGAGAATAGALAANAAGSKYAHSVAFDQFELNAQHTAKYIAEAVKQGVGEAEAEKQPEVLIVNQAASEHPQHARADGKTWAEFVDEGRAAALETQRG